jgi:hypothetical protein
MRISSAVLETTVAASPGRKRAALNLLLGNVQMITATAGLLLL